MVGRFRHCRLYAVLTLVVLNAVPATVLAASETVTISAAVPCPVTEVQPVITAPTSGSTFSETPITVTGTAGSGDTITLLRNGAAAGTALADGSGAWSLPVGLAAGSNTLVARACLDSTPVDVTLNVPQPPPVITVPGGPDDTTIVVRDGSPPYRLAIDYGDGQTEERPAEALERVYLNHRYRGPGTYDITVTAIDTDGRRGTIRIVRKSVDGRPVGSEIPIALLVALEVLMAALVFSIWEYVHRKHLARDRACPGVGASA